MKKYVELGDIANINVGVVLSRKKANYVKKTSKIYELFNLKVYEDNILGNKMPFEQFNSDVELNDYIAKEDDLLIRLAFPMKVVYVDKELSGKLISNQYVIVRFKNNKFKAKFVKWYLESEDAYHQMEKYLVGTAVRTIPVVKIKEIRIPKMNLKKQESIESLILNWSEQKKLINDLIYNKDRYINESIKKILKEEN